jgi:hypothetical protein
MKMAWHGMAFRVFFLLSSFFRPSGTRNMEESEAQGAASATESGIFSQEG